MQEKWDVCVVYDIYFLLLIIEEEIRRELIRCMKDAKGRVLMPFKAL
jgi:hypothetical protein